VGCLGFRVSGSGFQVQGFGFRVLAFGFRVSGFGFRVQEFGFRVQASRVCVPGFGVYRGFSPSSVLLSSLQLSDAKVYEP